MSESRKMQVDNAAIINVILTLMPQMEEAMVQDIVMRLSTMGLILSTQDPITQNIYNMPQATGSTPPRIPSPTLMNYRENILRLISWLEERKSHQLEKCHLRIEYNDKGEKTTILDTPETLAQGKATGRVKMLESLIAEIKHVEVDRLDKAVGYYTLHPVINVIGSPGFLGKGQGQKNIGVTDDAVEALINSLKGQGLMKKAASKK